MNLADVFAVVLIVLGLVAAFICYWLLAAGLFPQFVERTAERLGQQPIALFFLGVITLGPLLIGGGRALKAPHGGLKLLGSLLVLLPLLAALLGSAGLPWRIGRGLRSARDEAEPWRRMLRGGVVLGLSFVLPFIGTFLLLPFTLFAGFGALLVSLRAPRPLPPPLP